MGKKAGGAQGKASAKSSSAKQPASGEKRLDPEDDQELTFDELKQKYASKYNKSQIDQYWRYECKPVAAKAKEPTSKDEPVAAKAEEPASTETPKEPSDEVNRRINAAGFGEEQKKEEESDDDDDMPPLQPTASVPDSAHKVTPAAGPQDDSDDEMPPVVETKLAKPAATLGNKENESRLSNGYPAQAENKIVAVPPKVVKEEQLIFEEKFLDDGAKVYKVGQGLFFKKAGGTPKGGQVMKSCRPAGSLVFCTGRRWQGLQGGIWAELDGRREAGWALVKGKGFSVSGAILEDAADSGSTMIVLKFFHPMKQLDRAIVELLVKKTATFEEVRAKLCTLLGLRRYMDIVISKNYPPKSPNGFGYLSFDYIPKYDLLSDYSTVEESGFTDGHTVPWTYLGDLKQDMDLKLVAPWVEKDEVL